MSRKLLAGAIALAVSAAMAFTGTATAGNLANTTVTINAGGEVDGTVSSPAPKKCARGRLIKVFKVKPGKDEKVGSDEAGSLDGNKAEWSIGNPGVNGKIYAKAPKTDQCQPDKSPVVNA